MSSKPDTTSKQSSFRLNHKKQQNKKPRKTATILSELVWKLKESKSEYHLSWGIIERAQPYSAPTNKCNLCIAVEGRNGN